MMEDQSVLFAKKNKKQFLERLVKGITPEESEEKIAVFMAGSPGAGKTEVATGLAEIFKNVVIIDADIFRSYFPGYNGHNSNEFQKGASLMVEYALDYVLKKGYSFILDGTFAIGKSVENIQRALKRNYNTSIYYVYQDPLIAWDFTQKRERIEGRYVPKERFINAYFKARDNIQKVSHMLDDKVELVVVMKDYQNIISDIIDGVENIELVISNKYTVAELEEKLND
jgi:Uncharacterized protein conserved in bacteria